MCQIQSFPSGKIAVPSVILKQSMVNNLGALMLQIWQSIDSIGGPDKTKALPQYWSGHLRFFRQLVITHLFLLRFE